MKHLNEKLQKIELLISDDCPDKTKELIQEYWDHDSNYKFSEIPSQIRFKYRLKQKELNATVNKFSNLIFHIYCDTCKKIEPLLITSQTGFTDTIYQLKRKIPHKCEQCKTNEAELRQKRIVSEQDEKQKAQREMVMQLIKDSNNAIDAKAWNNLSEFENTVLKHAIQLDSIVELKKYYYGQGPQSYKMLFTVLRLLEAEKLLFLDVDLDDKNIIKNYGFLERLKDDYEYVNKKITIDDNISKVEPEKESNELHLKLNSNTDDENPNNPKYTSLFTVKEKVTLKPGDEFLCHMYNLNNGEIYLKIAPLESINNLPAQIELHSLPIELRIQIEEYLKTNPRLDN